MIKCRSTTICQSWTALHLLRCAEKKEILVGVPGDCCGWGVRAAGGIRRRQGIKSLAAEWRQKPWWETGQEGCRCKLGSSVRTVIRSEALQCGRWKHQLLSWVWNVPRWRTSICRRAMVGEVIMSTLWGVAFTASPFCLSPSWAGSTKRGIPPGCPQVCSRSKQPSGCRPWGAPGPSCLAPVGPLEIGAGRARVALPLLSLPQATLAGSWWAVWWVFHPNPEAK